MSQKIELYWKRSNIKVWRTPFNPYSTGNYGFFILQENSAPTFDIYSNSYGTMHTLMQISNASASSPVDTLTQGTQTLTFPGIKSPIDNNVSSISYSFVFNDNKGDGIVDSGSKYVCKIISGTGKFLNINGYATLSVTDTDMKVTIDFDLV